MSQTDDLEPQLNSYQELGAETAQSQKVFTAPYTPKLVLKAKPMSEYQGHLNLNTDPNKGLYILANFQSDTAHLPIKLLLDSGSSTSLLHNEVFNRIPLHMRPPIVKNTKQIRFADGSVQNSTGTITMPLQIGDHVQHISFVLGDYTDEGIIGINDIHALSLTINFQKMLVQRNDMWLPIHDVQNNLIGRKIVVRKSSVIEGYPEIGPHPTSMVCGPDQPCCIAHYNEWKKFRKKARAGVVQIQHVNYKTPALDEVQTRPPHANDFQLLPSSSSTTSIHRSIQKPAKLKYYYRY